MGIRRLDRRTIEENLEQLLELERHYSDDPNEVWTEENFLLDTEGKSDFSNIALNGEEIVGYFILTVKIDEGRLYGYINRTFVNPRYRDSSVYLRLFADARKKFRKAGIDMFRWKCSPDNKRVYEYHLRFADRIIGEENIGNKKYYIFEKRIK